MRESSLALNTLKVSGCSGVLTLSRMHAEALRMILHILNEATALYLASVLASFTAG